jgi:toxin HigB-1
MRLHRRSDGPRDGAPAPGHGELVARLAAERPALREAQVMGVRGAAAAKQTRLLGDRFDVILVTNASRTVLTGEGIDWTYRFAVRSAVIKSFADKRAAAIFAGYAVRHLPSQIQSRARVKLLAIDAAKQLEDLCVPPGNRLEALRGDRQGQYSLRISDQWRICFVWRNGEAWDVAVVDYH